MARFNAVLDTKTENLAGGQAHTQTPELELLSILLTSFANEQYYRSSGDTFAKIRQLVGQCSPLFAAKAAIYARTQFGMRSITHVLASEIAGRVAGLDWAKRFYDRIVYRPDDMMEILSYHQARGEKISSAMKRGFATALGRFDAYSLAKYRGEGKGFKLVDVVNLIHPKPTEKNREALDALMKGTLRSTDTWESELTKAGQTAETDEQLTDLKKDVWVKLVTERKIKYFALLRNLRNIIQQAPEVIDSALEMLTDEKLIRKSLVLPFRYTTAYAEISKVDNGPIVRKVLMALNKAVDIAVANVPVFDGETLVALDESGSMGGRPAEIGALMAAVLVKSNNADLLTFDSTARMHNVNPMDSTITIASSIRFNAGGTNFRSIFETATRPYDRIIILSDMQGWISYYTPKDAFSNYRKRTGADPYIYSFDLQGYGTMQFPERNVFAIAGFSEKVFDVMKLMEQDKRALINAINEVEI